MEILQDLLFDNGSSYWFVLLFIAAGVVCWIKGNSSTSTSLRRNGYILLGVGVLICVVAHLVDTPKETVIKHTKTLVRAAETRDPALAQSLIDPQVKCYGLDKPGLLNALKLYPQQLAITDISIGTISAQTQPNGIDVNISVVSHHDDKVIKNEAAMSALPTSWRLEWVKSLQGWQVKSIRCTQFAGQDGTTVESYLQRSGH